MSLTFRALVARPLSPFAERLEALRRDARTVLLDLLGRPPAPFSVRQPAARHLSDPPRRSADLLAHRSLVIERVVAEAPHTVSLHLADPTGAPIELTPGQFFTLVVDVPGHGPLKRAYSLSALPGKGENASLARITVKRVADGKVSNHLNEHARAGDVITVLGPSGSFGISPQEAAGTHLLLIGGGSGITPLRPILEARLADPSVRATLLYGNRAEQDIVFRRELDKIAAEHAGRVAVRYLLEAPPEGWTGGVGRLDKAVAAREIQAILGSELALGRTTLVLSCGPTPMMEAVRDALASLGVPRERLREEQFSSPDQRKPPAPTKAQPITFRSRGRRQDTIASPGQTVLEAGLSVGVDLPFSCAMGGCGACKVKVVSGRVVADEPNCLSADEASRGYVLTCVSRAAEPLTLEVP